MEEMIRFNLLCEYTRFKRVETQQETTTWKQQPFSGGRGNWIAVFKGYQLMGINLAMTIFQVHIAFWKDPNRRQSFPFEMVPFQVTFVTRWWFQIFFIFTSILGNDPI